MSQRSTFCRTGLLVASLVTGAFLSGLGAGVASPGTSAEVILNLNAGNFLEVTLPTGVTLRAASPPASVAPGTYQLIVNNDVPDTSDAPHMFHLSGPGVNLQTDLDAGDNKMQLFAQTLAPNATYVFQDDRQPSLGRVVFTTSAAGSTNASSTGSTSTSSSSSGSSTANGGSSGSGKTSNSSVIGSSRHALPFRGTLLGTVSANGVSRLTIKGKAISSLKAGRYAISVVDHTSKSGLNVQQARKLAIPVTGAAFVGKHERTVALTAGQWLYYTTFVGKKTYFIVTG